jgi:hypothetical protein
MESWSLRAKGTQLLHGGFLLFNSAYLSQARPLVQKCRKFSQLIGSAGRVDLNPAVIFVADPAAHPDKARVPLDKEAKSNALNTPRNKPAARFDVWPFQRAVSPRRADSESLIISSIASRKLFAVKGLEIRRNPLSTT